MARDITVLDYYGKPFDKHGNRSIIALRKSIKDDVLERIAGARAPEKSNV